jgi:glycosyltransferase involved in cell wall biosynthesis
MVTGTVADVRNYYRQAAVFVVPLRIGGGTKLKVLEAMAMALPVVTTTVGAQGLNVESGRHLFVADNPDDFAGRVLELLKDRKKAAQIGAAARRFVEQKYGWEAIIGDADHRLTRLFYK